MNRLGGVKKEGGRPGGSESRRRFGRDVAAFADSASHDPALALKNPVDEGVVSRVEPIGEGKNCRSLFSEHPAKSRLTR